MGADAGRYLARIDDPDLRLFAQIELAAALAGLPELHGIERQHAQPPGQRTPDSGSVGGVGSGKGGGLAQRWLSEVSRAIGPGEGGGFGGGVFRVGGGVTAPTLLYKDEPEYTEEARKAKFQGTVVLYVEVDPSNRTRKPFVPGTSLNQ